MSVALTVSERVGEFEPGARVRLPDLGEPARNCRDAPTDLGLRSEKSGNRIGSGRERRDAPFRAPGGEYGEVGAIGLPGRRGVFRLGETARRDLLSAEALESPRSCVQVRPAYFGPAPRTLRSLGL